MTSVVLDTSAVLAFLDDEPGAEEVFRIIRVASMSTVNLAEVYTKLTERGKAGSEAFSAVRDAIGQIVPFTAQMAEMTGSLRTATRKSGLSLGDRACIALGIALGAEIYTSDRVWADLALPCTIKLIR